MSIEAFLGVWLMVAGGSTVLLLGYVVVREWRR
jgi:hypothetical protein